MRRRPIVLLTALLGGFAVNVAPGAAPQLSFHRELPAGVAVEQATTASQTQAKAIGQKLGGKIDQLENAIVRVHGRTIQVNEITAADETNAEAIHASILKLKPFPFCFRAGKVVYEYVGQDIDEAIAYKTSYELGLLEKPERVRYLVVAELATVDKADYAACNPLFNQFLALQAGSNPAVIQQIDELSKAFGFGRRLVLRGPRLGNSVEYAFEPANSGPPNETGSIIAYSYDQLPERQGVPYVTATIELIVDDTGFLDAPDSPAQDLIAATPFWPTDDPQIIALAKEITEGKSSNGAKAMAILEWLTPGKNVKYSGQTGSRWGTTKVLEQRFGHCWDFSDCFVTLARAAGVPARQVAGWLYGSSGHVWAEFYRENKGWQQVDPTGGGKLRCGIYHIAYFTSDDGEMPIVYLSMPRIKFLEPK